MPFRTKPTTDDARECRAIRIWQQLTTTSWQFTVAGEPVKIIYPGRRNDDRGPDFRDAVLATPRGLRHGDIEIHVRASNWWTHGHHRDHHYNRVILHAVLQANTKTATVLENGCTVPTLVLKNTPAEPAAPASRLMPQASTPCRNAQRHRDINYLGYCLDEAGKQRFLAKAAQFQTELQETEPGETLYRGIMTALGYHKNKLAFRKLSQLLPAKHLQKLLPPDSEESDCLTHLQALFLGTAGFLPSQCTEWQSAARPDDPWQDRLEKIWADSQPRDSMPASEWNLFKVRPNNFPTRRLAGMSYLLLRYREKGLLPELISIFQDPLLATSPQILQWAFQVTSNGYWTRHIHAGIPLRSALPTLIGAQRADQIVVNILLPFAFAWGKLMARQELADTALGLFCRYPRLSANSVEKHMEHQLNLSRDIISSACRQQGLIHLYRNNCIRGRCDLCLLSSNPLTSAPRPDPDPEYGERR
ncbi:DUF2851 family protein [Chloroflexota bacterium]